MFKILWAAAVLLIIGNADAPQNKPTIVFFGDSITAGYGISLENAFPALIQDRIDSLGLNYQVINAGLSGETTAGGLQRIDWILRAKPAILVLELGGNDGLRGLSLAETRKNLNAMIAKIKAAHSETKILLAGMQIPPNLGQAYTEEFRGLFAEIARSNEVSFIPFLLEDVGGEKELNLSDGIHPNEKGHKIVVETVWKHIGPLLH